MASEPTTQQQARAALRDKYAETIQRVWRNPDDCPICKSNTWNLGDVIQAELREVAQITLAEALLDRPKQVYTYIPVTCLQCGYTIFFQTGILDIRASEEIKSEGPLRRPGTGSG